MTPKEKLEGARLALAQAEREFASMTCRERGAHRWRFEGGANAGCCDTCTCSKPVYVCKDCGDCDYGDNEERDEIVLACARLNG